MTNPDNVGGLPELPPSYGDHCVTDSVRTMREPGYTADQMRAYGEQWREYGFKCGVVEGRAAPAGGEPNGKLVGWWNGITPGFDGMGMPSIRWGADAEDSRHDIPLYDGYNPIHYVTPVSAPAGSGEVEKLVRSARAIIDHAVHGEPVSLQDAHDKLTEAAALLRKLSPAGSGEVVTDDMVTAALSAFSKTSAAHFAADRADPAGPSWASEAMRSAISAALLRKLQQGAE